MTIRELKHHEKRVVEERDQLSDRLRKLNIFIEANAQFASLDPAERDRLVTQRRQMSAYRRTLDERIAAFPVVDV